MSPVERQTYLDWLLNKEKPVEFFSVTSPGKMTTAENKLMRKIMQGC